MIIYSNWFDWGEFVISKWAFLGVFFLKDSAGFPTEIGFMGF